MNFFFQTLPDSTLLEILFVWLYQLNLVALDGAVCTKRDRPGFLALLANKHHGLCHVVMGANVEQFRWLVLRKVKMHALYIQRNGFVPRMYLLHTTLVRSLTVHRDTDNTENTEKISAALINACPQLSSLKMSGPYRDALMLHIQEKILHQLTELTSINSAWQNTSIHKLCSVCTNLRDINFDFPTMNDIAEDALLGLVQANPRLTDLRICNVFLTCAFYALVAANCKDLLRLIVFPSEACTMDAVIGVLLGCPLLQICSVYFTLDEHIQYNNKPTNNKQIFLCGLTMKQNRADRTNRLFQEVGDFHAIKIKYHKLIDMTAIWLSISHHNSSLRKIESDCMTEEALMQIMLHCPALGSLDLYFCDLISNEGFLRLLATGQTPNLTSFVLLSHPTITTETVLSILRTNPQLKKCEVYCTHVQREALRAYCTLNHREIYL
jgi:hypothetical protein